MSYEILVNDFRARVAPFQPSLVLSYGSCAYAQDISESDVDLLVVGSRIETLNDLRIAAIGCIAELHVKHGFRIDAEVPFENKLVVSQEDVTKAVDLVAFQESFDGTNTCYLVPPIEKNSIFLSSDAMRWRLILNALTTPHIFVAGNPHYYEKVKQLTAVALTRLALGLLRQGSVSVLELASVLERAPGSPDVNGEWYLGYKPHAAVTKHLYSVLNFGLGLLALKGQVRLDPNGIAHLMPSPE
jgi:hypothetical protein